MQMRMLARPMKAGIFGNHLSMGQAATEIQAYMPTTK